MSQTMTEVKCQEINRNSENTKQLKTKNNDSGYDPTPTSRVVCECPDGCCVCCGCCAVCCINPLIWICGYGFEGDESDCILRCVKKR